MNFIGKNCVNQVPQHLTGMEKRAAIPASVSSLPRHRPHIASSLAAIFTGEVGRPRGG